MLDYRLILDRGKGALSEDRRTTVILAAHLESRVYWRSFCPHYKYTYHYDCLGIVIDNTEKFPETKTAFIGGNRLVIFLTVFVLLVFVVLVCINRCVKSCHLVASTLHCISLYNLA